MNSAINRLYQSRTLNQELRALLEHGKQQMKKLDLLRRGHES